ncbi:hypothetical protein [Parabacteroides sp.]
MYMSLLDGLKLFILVLCMPLVAALVRKVYDWVKVYMENKR